jgi:hypothetical protein
MVLWDLFVEVFEKYNHEFWARRKKMNWKANLFFIPLVLAIFIALIVLFQTFIYPGRPL